jgi:hypothetical protein
MTRKPTRAPARKLQPKAVEASEEQSTATDGNERARAPRADKPSFLLALFAGLEQAHGEAKERVQKLQVELAEAERDLAAVNALVTIKRTGGLPPSGDGGAAPATARKAREPLLVAGGGKARGATSERVLELLRGVSAGLPAGAIIKRLQLSDPPEQSSVRNFLASAKRKNVLRYDEATKNYSIA